jgi:histidyl-tRNA synthetase
MRDLFGEEIAQWSYVEQQIRSVFSDFGYGEIRTPVLEKIEVFSQTVGDATDIVEKQMYLVESGEEKMVLRPEGTASFMRAVIEHQLHRTGKAQRFFYFLPMFRHERPQKGRLRQFHQFGAEFINDPSAEADAEIILLIHQLYARFGVTEYEVRINSVGCQDCRPQYKELLKDFLRPKFDSLCPQCQKRFERAPMRILDCKSESCQALLKGAPLILNHLCVNCKTHHATLKTRLTSADLTFIEDPGIVRGLDYYCRTAFEFTSNLLGAQSALVGGGRYDGLSTRFGEAPFPAVGFALGMERLMMVLEEKKTLPVLTRPPSYCFAPLGKEAFDRLFPIAFALRRRGVFVDMNYDSEKGLKALMKQADRSGAQFAVILGDTEIKNSEAIVKDMKAGTQVSVPLENLEEALYRRIHLAS